MVVNLIHFENSNVKSRIQPHELRTARRLAILYGMEIFFTQDFKWVTDTSGRKQKVGLPDLSDGTELKSIIGSKNAHGALKNHLNNALKKKNLTRVIVDNTEAVYITDDQLTKAAYEIIPDFPLIPKLSLLLKSGDLLDIK